MFLPLIRNEQPEWAAHLVEMPLIKRLMKLIRTLAEDRTSALKIFRTLDSKTNCCHSVNPRRGGLCHGVPA